VVSPSCEVYSTLALKGLRDQKKNYIFTYIIFWQEEIRFFPELPKLIPSNLIFYHVSGK